MLLGGDGAEWASGLSLAYIILLVFLLSVLRPSMDMVTSKKLNMYMGITGNMKVGVRLNLIINNNLIRFALFIVLVIVCARRGEVENVVSGGDGGLA